MDAFAKPAAVASCCLSAAFVERRRGGTDSISPAGKRRRLNANVVSPRLHEAVAAQGLTERIETSSPSREAQKYTEKLRPQLEHAPEPAPQMELAPKTKQSLALEVTLLRSLLKAKQEAEKKKQHELLVALQCTPEDERPAQLWAASGTASSGNTQRVTHSTVDGFSSLWRNVVGSASKATGRTVWLGSGQSLLRSWMPNTALSTKTLLSTCGATAR